MKLKDVVDLERYPIHVPTSDGFEALVTRVRDALAVDGCAVLDGFVRPDAVAEMAMESKALRAQTTATDRPWVPYPPYHLPEGETWPEGHPRVHRATRRNRFVCYDMLAPESATRFLYESRSMIELIRRCIGAQALYPYGDPLGACSLSIQEAGEELPWHFDLTHFIVSLLIQAPECGGVFEYAPHIRTETEEHYDKVRNLLRGGDEHTVALDLRPGDLQLFEGRCSMHRVTAPERDMWRCIALLSYCEEPGIIGDAKMQKHLFGRVDQQSLRSRFDTQDRLSERRSQ